MRPLPWVSSRENSSLMRRRSAAGSSGFRPFSWKVSDALLATLRLLLLSVRWSYSLHHFSNIFRCCGFALGHSFFHILNRPSSPRNLMDSPHKSLFNCTSRACTSCRTLPTKGDWSIRSTRSASATMAFSSKNSWYISREKTTSGRVRRSLTEAVEPSSCGTGTGAECESLNFLLPFVNSSTKSTERFGLNRSSSRRNGSVRGSSFEAFPKTKSWRAE
mmetsp:Transcript_50383/g.133763  ORF Transcript_50383/g.133763 Transcript_50383/m.133763 type:complete len:218 (+) Transcript_50383:661-1314(+)